MLLFLAHDLIRLFATLPLIVLRPCSGSRSTNMGRLYWLFQEFRCRCSEAKITNEQRIVAAALTILSWAAASVAVWFVFSALGEKLEPSRIVLLVAGLNFIGLLAAFTIGGIGVSESGLVVILAGIGFELDAALALALAGRPTILLLTLASCALVEGMGRLSLSSIDSARRKTELN